jgi:hypothetical protein
MGNLNLSQMTAGQTQKHVTSNDADNELDIAITESVVLDFTAGNITLTDAQLRENFLFECNNVVAARDLTLPATAIKRFFAVTVQSDETFNVTVKKGTGSSVVTPGNTKIFYTDGTTNDLRDIEAGGGGGTSWLDLSDTDPTSYTGQAGKLVRVNATPDGLEFVNPSASGGNAAGLVQGVWIQTPENRFHADNDDTIELVRLKAATFDDGAAVSDLANLLCDLTTTGAGALDTGTLTSSTWYSLYLIQRSDTDAVALLATLADDIDVDVSGTSEDADFRLRNSSAETNGAQSFQPSVTAHPSHVDLKIGETGTVPASSVWITIEADASGDPSGTPLMTSEKLDAAGFSTTDREIRFTFNNTASLTASTTYWIVIHADYAISGTNHLTFRGNTTSSYGGGLAKDFDGASTWTTPADGSIVDFWFKYYPRRAGDSPTMPASYDRQVKLGYFYTDISTDVESYKQIDKRVFWGDVHSVAPTASATVTLVDMKVEIPPTLCVAEVEGHIASGTGIVTVVLSGVPHGYASSTSTGGGHPQDYTRHHEQTSEINEVLPPQNVITQAQGLYMGSNSSSSRSLRVLGYTFLD